MKMWHFLHSVKLKNVFFVILVPILFYVLQSIFHFHCLESDDNHPIILWWTPFMAEEETIISCQQQRCLLTKNKKYTNSTNLKAVLFYGSQFTIQDLPIPKTHIWALFHEESPRNVALFLYNRTYTVFDITATFSRYSDFPLTLQYLENLSIITDTQYVVNLEEKNKLLGTIAPVLYIQSDCDTPNERDAYVSQLMKHIEVDSYGACLKNKHFPKEIAEIYSLDLYNKKLLEFVAKYKFVIAFENAICDDYITEKLWRPLAVGSIPIYMGSPSVEDWLPNKNSAILAKHFQNPKSLARYIHKINGDDALYESFLGHKNGIVENVLLKSSLRSDHSISRFECFVCERIHQSFQNTRSKSVYDCLGPSSSSWEYHWQFGDCQSKALVTSVQNNEKVKEASC